jgi:hypothetical protein
MRLGFPVAASTTFWFATVAVGQADTIGECLLVEAGRATGRARDS